MQLHDLRKEYKERTKKRIGRGGKRGTYSGKGQKGQKSRAGHKIRPAIRDLVIKLPKQRGFKFNSIAIKPVGVNFRIIDKYFNNNELVSPETLLAKGIIKKYKGIIPKVKILGAGKLKKKVTFKKCSFSVNAKKPVVEK
jgi:large subunit ribosomal protein L15